MSQEVFDTALLRARRGRIAAGAQAHDFLLQRVADDLIDRLSLIRRRFPVAVDLGAHHGALGRRLRELPGIEIVIAMDAASAMAGRCAPPRLVADLEALPFGEGTFDLVVSALALQSVNDLPGALVQIRRALKPDGLMLAAMLGGATLSELRQAMLEAESEIEGGASPRVAPFADVRAAGALLQRAGFALPVADADTFRVTYASPLDLMRDLKGMGASNALLARSRRPMRRRTLARACEIYVERFSNPDGRVTATFEVLTLTGWAPHPDQQVALKPGSARMRLADALAAGDASPAASQASGVDGGPVRDRDEQA